MATITDMGIPGLSSGILQPKQKNRWKVTFPSIGGEEGKDGQALSIQAITITRPTVTFEEVQLDRYNSKVFIAGKHTFEPITLTVEDDVSSGASSIIQAQLVKQQWLTGTEGQYLAAASEGSLYKFKTKLEQLDGNDTVIEYWELDGCFFSSVDYTDLDYSSSDATLITMTIRYDLATQTINKYAKNGTAV